jgi:DNA-binding MurR/RpiR family transcriptional regulator
MPQGDAPSLSPLLSIRSQRDQMSAIERRIADFILGNAHLLRDYSSQQLASALKISQSSVVKFSQKLGFKGYPDLKYSVGEALGRDAGGSQVKAAAPSTEEGRDEIAQDLWQSKSHAEEETRLINSRRTLDSVVGAIERAGRVFCTGLGEDGIAAQAFAARLAAIGIRVLPHTDPWLLRTSLAAADSNDVLVVFSEHGSETLLGRLSAQFRTRKGKVLSVTRNTANSLRAHAHFALLISAHDGRAHVKRLLYESARQQLLDLIFVLLCAGGRRPGELTDTLDD